MTDIDMSLWQGRVDPEDGKTGRRWHQGIQAYRTGLAPGVALIGFASDAGVARNRGRTGAAQGPQALRRMLANLAYHGSDTVPLIDAGTISCEGDALEQAQQQLGQRIAKLRQEGHWPVVLGGGHEVAWGSFQGIEASLGQQAGAGARIGIINFDAHFDLRRVSDTGRGSSGTPFFQIDAWHQARGLPFHYLCLGISEAANTPALFAAARERGVKWLEDRELIWSQLAHVQQVIAQFIASVDLVQLSLCLDVFPASVAPGVSAPAARGVPVDFAFTLLSEVLQQAQHGGAASKIALAEVAELNPRFDQDERTARLAARLVYELCTPRL